MSTIPVNLKDVAAAAQELIAQLRRDAESMSDRLKRQGAESAQAVTGALAQLQEGLGETSDMMLAASHVFVQRFDVHAGGYGADGRGEPLGGNLEFGNNQRVELCGNRYGDVFSRIKPGKHKAILFIIPEEG